MIKIEDLLQKLEANDSSITKIDLTHSDPTIEQVLKLLQFLKTNPHVQSLNMAGSLPKLKKWMDSTVAKKDGKTRKERLKATLSNEFAKVFPALVDMLTGNSTLKILNLNGNDLGVDINNLCNLTKALKALRSLSQLFLAKNKIAGDALGEYKRRTEAIADVIKGNKTLECIDLSDNSIGYADNYYPRDEEIEKLPLVAAVKNNKTLTQLNLSGNHMRDKYLDRIKYLLQCNVEAKTKAEAKRTLVDSHVHGTMRLAQYIQYQQEMQRAAKQASPDLQIGVNLDEFAALKITSAVVRDADVVSVASESSDEFDGSVLKGDNISLRESVLIEYHLHGSKLPEGMSPGECPKEVDEIIRMGNSVIGIQDDVTDISEEECLRLEKENKTFQDFLKRYKKTRISTVLPKTSADKKYKP